MPLVTELESNTASPMSGIFHSPQVSFALRNQDAPLNSAIDRDREVGDCKQCTVAYNQHLLKNRRFLFDCSGHVSL